MRKSHLNEDMDADAHSNASSSSASTATTTVSLKENFAPRHTRKTSVKEESPEKPAEPVLSVQERMKLFASMSLNSFSGGTNSPASGLQQCNNSANDELSASKLSQIAKVHRRNMNRFQTQVSFFFYYILVFFCWLLLRLYGPLN